MTVHHDEYRDDVGGVYSTGIPGPLSIGTWTQTSEHSIPLGLFDETRGKHPSRDCSGSNTFAIGLCQEYLQVQLET